MHAGGIPIGLHLDHRLTRKGETMKGQGGAIAQTDVIVQAEKVQLDGNLACPEGAHALVLFAHGSGSSRHSPRNRSVAAALNEAGLATLLFDLLTPDEDRIDRQTRALRFDIDLLANRLTGAVDWVGSQASLRALRIGLFGASTGAAAALIAAAHRPDAVGAVVSRGGRPDLAGEALARVRAPTLLIVGGKDTTVVSLNRTAGERLIAENRLAIIPGATHLFEESGALEEVARLACDWFTQHLD
jgi:putative phosphoribosyl transferase